MKFPFPSAVAILIRLFVVKILVPSLRFSAHLDVLLACSLITLWCGAILVPVKRLLLGPPIPCGLTVLNVNRIVEQLLALGAWTRSIIYGLVLIMAIGMTWPPLLYIRATLSPAFSSFP